MAVETKTMIQKAIEEIEMRRMRKIQGTTRRATMMMMIRPSQTSMTMTVVQSFSAEISYRIG